MRALKLTMKDVIPVSQHSERMESCLVRGYRGAPQPAAHTASRGVRKREYVLVAAAIPLLPILFAHMAIKHVRSKRVKGEPWRSRS